MLRKIFAAISVVISELQKVKKMHKFLSDTLLRISLIHQTLIGKFLLPDFFRLDILDILHGSEKSC